MAGEKGKEPANTMTMTMDMVFEVDANGNAVRLTEAKPAETDGVFITPQRAADILGLSYNNIIEWLNRAYNPLPHFRHGRDYKIVREGLEDYALAEVVAGALPAKGGYVRSR